MSSQHHGRGRPPPPGVGDPDLPHPVPAAPAAPAEETAPGDCGLDDGGLIREIETCFPGWGVWRSDTRRWWAFRTSAHPLTIDQLRAGCRLIVQADTAPGLRAAIMAANDCAHRVA